MAITFDSTTLTNASIVSQDRSSNHFRATFRCVTASYADITTLAAKFGGTVNRRVLTPGGEVSLQGPGTSGTLAIGATNYPNCMITDIKVTPSNRKATHYEYFVSVEQDTAG